MDSGRCPVPGWHVSGPDSASGQTSLPCHGRFLGAALEHNDLMPKRQDLHPEGGARAED
jgi:hypothetical protein